MKIEIEYNGAFAVCSIDPKLAVAREILGIRKED